MAIATNNGPASDSPTGPTKAWAVVTETSSGIGHEFALALAERGNLLLAVKVVGAFDAFLTIADRFTPRSVVRRLMGYLWQPPPGTTTPPRTDTAAEPSEPALRPQP